MNSRLDVPLILSGAVVAGIGFYGRGNIQPYTKEELNALEAPDVWDIDRSALSNWSPRAQNVSDVLLIGGLATPLALIANRSCRNDWLSLAVMYGETVFLTYGITDILKTTIKRDRPLVFNDRAPHEEKTLAKARMSFPSGHTSMSAAAFVFTSAILTRGTKNNSWDPVIWGVGFAAPAVVGWLRVEGGKHYTTDVIAGYAIGALIGFGIPWLHDAKRNQGSLSFNLRTLYGQPSAQLTWSPRSRRTS